MSKYFRAAISGQGRFWTALRTAWASSFTGIRAFVMIPSKSEKLELSVSRDARNDSDHVRLTRRNWRTGEENELYNGKITGGKSIVKPQPRD